MISKHRFDFGSTAQNLAGSARLDWPPVSDISGRTARIVACIVIACALALSLHRLRCGVDLEDEATYVSIPMRFLSGDRPFVDETNPVQSASLLTTPFIGAFVAVSGGTEGVMLFTRSLYFVVTLGVAALVARALRKYVEGPTRWLLALPVVLMMPGLPNLSYHTIGSLGFTAGVFAVVLAATRERRREWLFVAGVAHGMSVVAYQGYAPGIVLFLVCAAIWIFPDRRARDLAAWVVGLLIVLVPVAPFFLAMDPEVIERMLKHAASDVGFDRKIMRLLRGNLLILEHPWLLAGVLGAAYVCVRRRIGWLACVLVASLPLIAYAPRESNSATCYTTVLACLAPFLYAMAPDPSKARPLLLGVWLPSFVCGIGIGLTSSMYVASEGHAQIPAAIVSGVYVVWIVREMSPAHWRSFELSWPVVVIGAFVIHQRHPYDDDQLSLLDHPIESGPWRGIRTTAQKAEFMAAIQSDLRTFEGEGRSVLFHPHFPAGYLMTTMRTAPKSVWSGSCLQPSGREACAEDIERVLASPHGERLVAFDMHIWFRTTRDVRPIERTPARQVLEREMTEAIQTPTYTVFWKP